MRPGPLGVRPYTFDHNELRGWLNLFPEDEYGLRMPPGLMASVIVHAYDDLTRGRPSGGVHARQTFTVTELPHADVVLNTAVNLIANTEKRGRHYLEFEFVTRDADARLLWTARMTTIWPA